MSYLLSYSSPTLHIIWQTIGSQYNNFICLKCLMAGNGRGKYLSLGDWEISGYCVSGKKNAKTNWKEMVNCNDKRSWNGNYWLKEKTFGPRETTQGVVIYNLQGQILNKYLLTGIFFPKDNKWKGSILFRDLTKESASTSHLFLMQRHFRLEVSCLEGLFYGTTVFWGPPPHGQEIGLAQSLPIWEENGIVARIILNSYTCQFTLSVKRTMAWT